MKRLGMFSCFMAIAALFAVPAIAEQGTKAEKSNKPAGVMIQSQDVSATVQTINQETRMVDLKFPDGHIERIKAGPEIKNLHLVKEGDTVRMQRFRSVAVALEKKGSEIATGTSTTVEAVKVDGKPAKRIINTIQVVGTVEEIDYASRMVTLRNSEGATESFKVDKAVKRFKEIKKGDSVVVRVTEAFAVSVHKG